MKQLLSLMARAGAVAVCMLTAGHGWAGAPAAMAAPASQTWIAASDSTLAKMRGGFDLGGGLAVSFGFMSSVAINGSQVVNSTFTIPNLSAITPQQAVALNQQLGLKLVQNGPGNTAGPIAGSPGGHVTANPGPIQSPAPGGVSVANGAGSVTVNTGGSAAPQVTTATNMASVSILPANAAALGTIVQNTLNNQTIQTNTVINIGTNGLSILRGLNFLHTLNSVLANSIGGGH